MRRARATWPDVSAAIVPHLLTFAAPFSCVSGVWPLPGELDLRPALQALIDAGHSVALPETTPRGEPLVFRRWRPGCTMIPGRFGTVAPDGEVIHPDLILVPLLAFDRRGHRLGYGGGYYDRTLAARPAAARAGVGWAASQVDAVPAEPYDVALPAVITELGLIVCGEV